MEAQRETSRNIRWHKEKMNLIETEEIRIEEQRRAPRDEPFEWRRWIKVEMTGSKCGAAERVETEGGERESEGQNGDREGTGYISTSELLAHPSGERRQQIGRAHV